MTGTLGLRKTGFKEFRRIEWIPGTAVEVSPGEISSQELNSKDIKGNKRVI